ncbi:MAG TPA: redoxin domain-containing protein [Terriglobales bacterium]|jgi:peroxiredoxin|nr:redoxin domain-containing protein [Terriglobales bacterium]
MAASLKHDYGKILKAGADLVMISPDSLEEHRKYALALFGEELPYRYVSDGNLDIARRYGLLRKREHHHGGFYYRSLWILNREATVTHKSVPWEGNSSVKEYQRLFKLIGSEPGEWRATCGLQEAQKLHAN